MERKERKGKEGGKFIVTVTWNRISGKGREIRIEFSITF
jgi:hypothetical protein